MEVQSYTEKSIAVFGETKPWAGKLASLGGKFNSNLRSGPGWIFSKTREADVFSFVQQANDGLITPPPVDFEKTGGLKLNKVQNLNPFQQSASMSSLDALSRLESSHSRAKAKAVLESSPIPVNFPNVFQAADDNIYQIAIYTLPMPIINNLLTVEYGSQNATYTIEYVKPSNPVDFLTLSLQSSSSDVFPDKIDSYVISGSWKLDPFKFPFSFDSYKLTFD